MNTQNPDKNFDADLALMTDPEFRHVLGDLMEAMERGEPDAFDRCAGKYPQYAPALLQTALYALPAEDRVRSASAPESDPAVDAGILAAMNALGIAPAKTILAARTDRGWSLGDLARRLLVPARLALKLERGQIVSWPERLTTKLAEALDTTRDQAQAMLQTTVGSFRMEAAAFSAEGDPDVAQAAKNRTETFDFEEALAKEQPTPEQVEFWNPGG